jgi:hypothetical protein
MAKFIRVTEAGSEHPLNLNLDNVLYTKDHHSGEFTEVFLVNGEKLLLNPLDVLKK